MARSLKRRYDVTTLSCFTAIKLQILHAVSVSVSSSAIPRPTFQIQSIFKRLSKGNMSTTNHQDENSVAAAKLRDLKDCLFECNLGLFLTKITDAKIVSLDDLNNASEEQLLAVGLKKAHLLKVKRALTTGPWQEKLSSSAPEPVPTPDAAAADADANTALVPAIVPREVVEFLEAEKLGVLVVGMAAANWVKSLEALNDATDETLLAIGGMKKAHVLKIRRALKNRGASEVVQAATGGEVQAASAAITVASEALEETNDAANKKNAVDEEKKWREAEQMDAAMGLFEKLDRHRSGKVSQIDLLAALRRDQRANSGDATASGEGAGGLDR